MCRTSLSSYPAFRRKVSSIFRAEQYPILKMAAARSSETLDAKLPNYKDSHPSRRSRDRIPVASVTGNFLVDTDRTMCPGVNSASKKWVPGIPVGVKAAGAWGWLPTTLVVPNVKKSGALTYLDPLGPSRRPVVGETFTFTLIPVNGNFNHAYYLLAPKILRRILDFWKTCAPLTII